jgi:hypothetical protein
VSLPEAALGLARESWLVFPCHSLAADGFCTCGKPGCTSPAKHPRTKNGLHDASSDPAQVMAWWSQWPDANIGLRTGDGMFVIDPDGPEGAATVEGMDLPPTLAVVTGNGRHLYFFAPEGVEIRNRARVAPGLDVRGDGGYVIAPPSVHASGAVYEWVDQEAEIAEAPEWLVELVRVREPVSTLARPAQIIPKSFPGEVTPYARAALDAEVRNVLDAPRGTQNDTLNRAAFALGQFVASGALPESEVCSTLMGAWDALEPGNGPGMAAGERTMRSGLESGMRYPREVPEHRTRREAPVGTPHSTEEPNTRPIVAGSIGEDRPQAAALEVIVAEPLVPTQASTNGSRPHVEYPLGVWPGPVADFIEQTAVSVCVAPEAVGTCVLAVAAGAIGRARWLAVKDDWTERPGIYAGLVAASGERKSPAMRAVKAPLEAIHGEAAARWLKEHEEWEATPGKTGEPELAAPMLKDVTTEVLGLALRAHPRGVVLVRPELVGWVKSHGQYKAGRGDDRQKWLEAHDQELLDVRRVGRKPILVPNPVVSVLGGVQPAVFSAITSVEDGLAERFLYDVMPPQELRASTPAVSRASRETWEAIVRELYGLVEAEVVCEAEGCLVEARQHALDLRKGAPARMRSYYGKGEMHLARIAIVLQAVWEVSAGAGRELTAAGVGRAEDLWGFHAAQAERLFCGDVVPVGAFEPASPAKEQELVMWLRYRGGTAPKREAMNKGPLQHMSSKDVDTIIYTAAARGSIEVANGERGRVILTVSG